MENRCSSLIFELQIGQSIRPFCDFYGSSPTPEAHKENSHQTKIHFQTIWSDRRSIIMLKASAHLINFPDSPCGTVNFDGIACL